MYIYERIGIIIKREICANTVALYVQSTHPLALTVFYQNADLTM